MKQALPDLTERFAQMNRAASTLTSSGYTAIGIDHFALPADSLAIAAASGTHAQKLPRLHQRHRRRADRHGRFLDRSIAARLCPEPAFHRRVPAAGQSGSACRWCAASSYRKEDRIRARIIELLMCDFAFSFATIRHEFGGAAESILDEAEYLATVQTQMAWSSFPAACSRSRQRDRPFVRSVASAFDGYFGTGVARHSLAV